ncbi:MAG: ABC transporter ATP-binding protein [Muribaculaceae bacterium]|nr:ABC transporter ATP-binding protein [Muribaculaceae bacterium]
MIEVKDIRKSYGQLEVLKGVTLSVNPGEVVSVVGASGAGKTTLLQIMGTLDQPDSGTVTYDGVDVTRMRGNELAHFRNTHIGFVFQAHQLLPEFSLIENVMMPALIGGQSTAEARRRAQELIEYLGLTGRAGHRPSELSGGEKQRAAVARALVNRPMVVLADEPSGSLDSHNRRELHELFFNLSREQHHTFVIVTHDDGLAEECDRVIHLADGQVTSITEKK